MPIQFRCSYCNQLLGIARRKAGTVIDCPTCGTKVVVPRQNQTNGSQSKPAPGAGLLEMSNIDALLRPPVPGKAVATAGPAEALPQAGLFPSATAPAPRAEPVAGPLGVPEINVEPLPIAGPVQQDMIMLDPDLATGRGVLLTPAKVTLVTVIMILLITTAFLIGFLLGRSAGRAEHKSNATPSPHQALIASCPGSLTR